MNLEARIAYINAQTAMFNAKIAQMVAGNMQRASCGESMLFTHKEFQSEIEGWEGVLSHNAVIGYLRE